jgi:hypothetical protein
MLYARISLLGTCKKPLRPAPRRRQHAVGGAGLTRCANRVRCDHRTHGHLSTHFRAAAPAGLAAPCGLAGLVGRPLAPSLHRRIAPPSSAPPEQPKPTTPSSLLRAVGLALGSGAIESAGGGGDLRRRPCQWSVCGEGEGGRRENDIGLCCERERKGGLGKNCIPSSLVNEVV